MERAYRMRRFVISKVKIVSTVLAVLALSVTVAFAGLNENLLEAARLGNLPEVKRLLDAGAAVNARDNEGETALMLASGGGHREVVELLLAKEAEVNAKGTGGETALMGASFNGHREIVELFLAKRAEVNAKMKEDGENALMLASNKATGGCGVAPRRGSKSTPRANTASALKYASFNGQREVVELLLSTGGRG